MNQIPFYLSNSLFSLTHLLIENIEACRKTERFYQSRHLIVVASHEKRTWLIQKFSECSFSLLDVDILLLEEFFVFLKGPKRLPSWKNSLLPAIVSSKWNEQNEEANGYFHTSAISLFKGSPISDEEKFIEIWNSLKKEIPELFLEYLPILKNGFLAESYHTISFFGFSSLCEGVLAIFTEIGSISSIPLFFYAISPCLHFWSDIKTKKEIRDIIDIIKKKKTSQPILQYAERALSRKNDLLGNWGVLAREFAKQIEEGPFYTIPAYSIPKNLQQHPSYRDSIIPEYLNCANREEKEGSLLHRIQADIVSFVSTRETKEIIAPEEDSISFLLAPTLLQEVQAVRNYLLNKSPTTIEIGSILILVPSLDQYKELFLQVFHKDQPAKIQFWPRSKEIEANRFHENEFLSWISSLFLFLGAKKKDKSVRKRKYTMMNFAFHPLTLRALFGEDVALLEREFRSYIESLDVRDWYISKEHLEREMEAKGVVLLHKERSKDFTSIKKQKIDELIGESSHYSSSYNVEMDSAFISLSLFFESCDRFWNIPVPSDSMKKIEEWTALLQKTINYGSLFEKSISEEDLEAFELVIARFYELHSRFPEVKMGFSWFSSAFERELFDEVANRQQLRKFTGHIIVSDRSWLDSIPCKGMAILGASQNQFPVVTKEHLLSHIAEIAPTLFHDPSAIDKELFLEQLLSSSSWFYCSAVAQNHEKDGLYHFSSLVRDLIRYIDQNFIYADGKTFSSKNVQYEKSYRASKEGDIELLFSRSSPSLKKDKNFFISIEELFHIAQNPSEQYFKSCFSANPRALYSLLYHDVVKKERIKPSKYAIKKMISEKLQSPLLLKEQNQKNYSFPKGYIGSISEELIEREACLIYPKKGNSFCEAIDLFLYEYEYTSKDEMEIGSSSPIVLLDQSNAFFVTGRFTQLSKEVFLFLSKDWEEEMYQRFPEYIIRAYLFYRGEKIDSLSLQWQGVNAKMVPFNDRETVETALRDWLLFVSESKNRLFPFTKTIIELLLSFQKLDLSHPKEYQDAIEELQELLIKESEKGSVVLQSCSALFSLEYITALFEIWRGWAEKLYRHLDTWIISKPFHS